MIIVCIALYVWLLFLIQNSLQENQAVVHHWHFETELEKNENINIVKDE